MTLQSALKEREGTPTVIQRTDKEVGATSGMPGPNPGSQHDKEVFAA